MISFLRRIKRFFYQHASGILYVHDLTFPAETVKKKIPLGELEVYKDFHQMSLKCKDQLEANQLWFEDTFKKRFSNGYIFFLVRSCENQIAHYIWASFINRYIEYVDTHLDVGNDEAYLIDGYTFEKFRGLSIFPWTLQQVQHYFRARQFKKILFDIRTNNFASRKGTEKAGFQAIFKYDLFIVCNHRFTFKKQLTPTDKHGLSNQHR